MMNKNNKREVPLEIIGKWLKNAQQVFISFALKKRRKIINR